MIKKDNNVVSRNLITVGPSCSEVGLCHPSIQSLNNGDLILKRVATCRKMTSGKVATKFSTRVAA